MVVKIAILGAQGSGRIELTKALVEVFADRADGFLWVDTTTLMRAIETELASSDPNPDHTARRHHFHHVKNSHLILVMGLDWPWPANDGDPDGLLRRSQVDARLRQILQAAQLNYVVVYGHGTARTECALQAIAHHRNLPLQPTKPASPWQWTCDNCSDGACEHRLFTGLL